MKFQYVFEKAEAWKQSVELAKEVHELDSRFHNYEKFDIVKKLRNLSADISADVAVSSTHFTAKKKDKFTEKVNRKITRFLSHLLVGRKLGYISSTDFVKLKEKVDAISHYTHSLSKEEILRAGS